jgi:hypothetical protein
MGQFGFDPLVVIGMTEKQAMETLLAKGKSVRLAERNGVSFGMSEDRVADRVSLFVADDKVFRFVVG